MPRLRDLSGRQVLDILARLGFQVIRTKGSHVHLRLQTNEATCYVTVPVHRKKSLPPGTLRSIYRQALPCVPEDELRELFYSD